MTREAIELTHLPNSRLNYCDLCTVLDSTIRASTNECKGTNGSL